MRSVYGDHDRFVQTYFATYEGKYFTGDGCRRDEDGYYWITGRVDDVLNVSGHRIGTAEVESALVSHQNIAEAAVIGKPHDVKGESIKAFCILNQGVEADESLVQDVKLHVRQEVGALAIPDEIDFVPSLPKTRSGKIMRRVLKAQELGEDVGDTSTLEE